MSFEFFSLEPEMEVLRSGREWAQNFLPDHPSNAAYLVFHFSCHIRAGKVKNYIMICIFSHTEKMQNMLR